MTTATAIVETVSVRNLEDVQRELTDAGRYVTVASLADGIDRRRCSAMQYRAEVMAAGSLDLPAPAELGSRPGQRIQLALIDTGILRIFRTTFADNSGTVWLGDGLAADLETLPSTISVQVEKEPFTVMTVAGVLDSRRNASVEQWMAVVTAPDGVAQECWIEFVPAAYDTGVTVTPLILGRADVKVRPALFVSASSRDPVSEFQTRPSRYAWVVVATLSVLVFWLGGRARRADSALYRTFGLTNLEVILMAQSEVSLILVIFSIPSYVLSALALGTLGHASWMAVLLGLRAMLMAVAAILVAAPAGVISRRDTLLELLKGG